MKYVIFDLDGVIVNTEPLNFYLWKKVCKDYGIDLDYDVYKYVIGSTIEYLFTLIKDAYHVDFHGNEDVLKLYNKYKDEILETEGFPKNEGVEDIVHYLKQKGYILAIASSSPQKYIELAVKFLGIEDCFDTLVSGEKVKNPKPAPDVFLKAASAINANPEECLVVEDSTKGVQAAKNAGMHCYGFINPDSGNQDVSKADFVFERFEQLKDKL